MHNTRILSVLLLGTLAVLHPAWSSGMAMAAVGQDYMAAKGFVTAKTAGSLTVLASDGRVLVVITNNTRVVGQRDSFARIVSNDVVRAEGRRTASNRLLADRIEVVFATDSMKVQEPSTPSTIEFITIRM